MTDGFDPRMMVKQYVAVVRSKTGQRFMVFCTGDAKWFLFCPLIGESSMTGDLQFPVKKSDLRDDIRRSLSHGVGNGEQSMTQIDRPISKVTRFTARDSQGNEYRWAFWFDKGYKAWFLRDPDGYERRMGDNWQDTVPRIRQVLENHGMTAAIS